jgi:hypothetical protein
VLSVTENTILLLQKTMKGRHLTASLFLMRENSQGKMVKDTVRGKYYFKDVKDFWLAETFSLECFLFFVLQGRRSFRILHCKKRLAVFPSPAGMSLTKLSLGGNNLIIPGQ